MRSIREGDEQAFSRLYELTRRSVYYTAYSVCRDKYAAETVMQDTFVKFYECIAYVDEKHNPYSYLLTIARNLSSTWSSARAGESTWSRKRWTT